MLGHGHNGGSSTFASHLFLPQLLERGLVYIGFLLLIRCIVMPMSYYVLGLGHLLILEAAAQNSACELSHPELRSPALYLKLHHTAPDHTTP